MANADEEEAMEYWNLPTVLHYYVHLDQMTTGRYLLAAMIQWLTSPRASGTELNCTYFVLQLLHEL
jgi:hypothetical protein